MLKILYSLHLLYLRFVFKVPIDLCKNYEYAKICQGLDDQAYIHIFFDVKIDSGF